MDTYLDPEALTPRQRRMGVTRRLRALAWMGWSPDLIALRYGVHDDDLATYTCDGLPDRSGKGSATVDTWYAVAVAYDDLSMRFGPDQEWRRLAVANRWPPPLAWDDEALDDPQGKPLAAGGRAGDSIANLPDHAVVFRRLHGDRTVRARNADIVAIVREAHRYGWNDEQTARRTGIAGRVVARIRQRLGLPHNYDPQDTRNEFAA